MVFYECQNIDRFPFLHYNDRMKFNGMTRSLLLLIALSLMLTACAGIVEPALPPVQEPTLPVITSTPINLPELTEEIAAIAQQEVRIKDGDEALAFGDYDQALEIYTNNYEFSSDTKVRATALFGMCLAYLKTENYPSALSNARELVTQFPQEIPAQRAFLLLAWTYEKLDRTDEALEAYNAYLKSSPGIIDSYVYEKIGDIYVQNSNYPEALTAYKTAYFTPKLGDGESISIKIADIYVQMGNNETALSLYQDIYHTSESDYVKSQMDILMGRVYTSMGQSDLAYEKYQDAVNNFPHTYDAYAALSELVNNDQKVSELNRGLINANIGQYDLAIEAYNRYLQEENADISSGLYYKALAVRALGIENAPFGSTIRNDANKLNGVAEDNEAISLWRQLISQYPNSQYAIDAWEDIAYTQSAYIEDPKAAAMTARDFVASAPDSLYASSILFSAGRYFEISGDLQEAAATWSRLGTEYPNTDETFQALLFAGISYYRLADTDNALLSFNRAVVLSLDPLETSAAYLWIGKVQSTLGNTSEANDAWRQAIASDPYGYYGLRAEELLAGQTTFQAPGVLMLNIDLEDEKQAANLWLINNFNLPSDTNLDDPGFLTSDDRLIRGKEFWTLGEYSLAKSEFESLRVEKSSDPAAMFQLITIFLDLGLYKSAIESAKSILALAGVDPQNVSAYPKYFGHAIYGLYYLPWIQKSAESYDIPLLFLYSLIYQESHFEGFITSSAGAMGLMQILPQTGAQIASEINWPPDFQPSDLSIPMINLTLGTNYLSRQLLLFEGDFYAAAAAYNGGPGSALGWKEISGDDPDLFLGVVRFLETRTYIRQIAEIYAVYVKLYTE
jgi:soluble lytic murein transglycosylase